MNPRRRIDRIKDILDAIDTIHDLKWLRHNYSYEIRLESVAYATLSFCLMIIGEAIKNLDDSFVEANPSDSWEALAQMRNQIAHQYFAVDSKLLDDMLSKHVEEIAIILERYAG